MKRTITKIAVMHEATVVGDGEIKVAVMISIPPETGKVPAYVSHARSFGDICKLSIAVVAVQAITTSASQVLVGS